MGWGVLLSLLTEILSLIGAATTTLEPSNFTQCNVTLTPGSNLFDISYNLLQCNQLMPDPLLPISYLQQYENIKPVVSTQLVLNNLILINEVEKGREDVKFVSGT